MKLMNSLAAANTDSLDTD